MYARATRNLTVERQKNAFSVRSTEDQTRWVTARCLKTGYLFLVFPRPQRANETVSTPDREVVVCEWLWRLYRPLLRW